MFLSAFHVISNLNLAGWWEGVLAGYAKLISKGSKLLLVTFNEHVPFYVWVYGHAHGNPSGV